jgi:hypothetical protein
VVDAVKSGHNIMIITDRKPMNDHVAIPALLATSTVHQHSGQQRLRTTTGLVVETGSARETHHFALLAGYGAKRYIRIWRWKRWLIWRKICRRFVGRKSHLQLHQSDW